MATDSDLVKKLENLVGIPWCMKGRNPRDGMDCFGLVLWAYRELRGYYLPDYFLLAVNHFKPVKDSPKFMDVVLLKTPQYHPELCLGLGIYLDYGRFITTTGKTGMVISTVNLNKLIAGYMRLKSEC